MPDLHETGTVSAAHAAQELVVVFSRLRRRLREVATVGELTPSQTSVLSRLSKAGPASASDLAAAERVRPQSMAATLAALTDRALIRRDPDPNDGRRFVVSLAEAGDERIRGMRAAREEWLITALEEQFTEPERRTVVEAMAILERLTQGPR